MDQELTGKPAERWMQYMRKGKFAEAWSVSDRLLSSRAPEQWRLPRHYQMVWDGTSLAGKRVLVRCYHGLGDTIQFIRYAPLLREIAKEVIVWAQPELIPLLRSVAGIDRLVPLNDGVPGVEYDLDIEVMELPYIFRSTLSTIPSYVPYLDVEPLHLTHSERTLSVGLVWRAGFWDQRRNIPFSDLAPLFRVDNTSLFILQAGAASAGWKEGLGIHPGEFSLSDYARVISGLDLLISVDSMPVHLAGALGVPVWTLLQKEADWRWMENRTDSPWYPSMRLFRQEEQGNWKPVIENVTSCLKQVAKQIGKEMYNGEQHSRRA
jgi:hypothetical protein